MTWNRPLSNLKQMQAQGEEIANSISHGIGLFGALIGTPFLIIHTLRHGDTGFIVGTIVFAASMVLLYLASTLYHAWPVGKVKRCFRIVEHSAIFILIAGTLYPIDPWHPPRRIRLDALRIGLGVGCRRNNAKNHL